MNGSVKCFLGSAVVCVLGAALADACCETYPGLYACDFVSAPPGPGPGQCRFSTINQAVLLSIYVSSGLDHESGPFPAACGYVVGDINIDTGRCDLHNPFTETTNKYWYYKCDGAPNCNDPS